MVNASRMNTRDKGECKPFEPIEATNTENFLSFHSVSFRVVLFDARANGHVLIEKGRQKKAKRQ